MSKQLLAAVSIVAGAILLIVFALGLSSLLASRRGGQPPAPAAPAASPTSTCAFTLHGRVYAADKGFDFGLAGAHVAVELNLARSFEATTDAKGDYFLVVPAGYCQAVRNVSVSAEGYQVQALPTSVDALAALSRRDFALVALSPTAGESPTPLPPLPTLGPVPNTFPFISQHPAVPDWGRHALASLPTYDANSDNTGPVDLRMYDLARLDLRSSLDDLMYADFDTQTKWPPADKMPPGFDWQQIMELGKNPGLGVRSLHAQGITGRGVGLAIIDQPLLVDHQEYRDQLRLYEELNIDPGTPSQMHGPAVASIAVGKTVGVAPEADLYYLAAWAGQFGAGENGHFTYDFRYYAQAIRRILEINRQLPVGHKIRVIAMQIGWSPDQAGYADIMTAVQAAKAAGLLVVSSSLEETFGFKFHGLGRPPLADPDQFEAYVPGVFWAKEFYTGSGQTRQFYAGRLLVPMDSRTTASPGGPGEYVFYREGGWSWSIPYIAGTYALAAQVKPSITPDEFWAAALQTGRTIQLTQAGQTYPFGPILDPVALIAALR